MDKRPHVKAGTENRVNEFRAELARQLPNFTVLPGVLGVTLNGGVARGYADQYSEIDLTLFLETSAYCQWQQGRAPITLGICKMDGWLYDIKVVDYYQERERTWDMVELWDLSYAQILWDPQELLNSLFAEKLKTGPLLTETEGLMFDSFWHFRLAGDIWIHRGDSLQGHFVLNNAVMSLLKVVYLLNDEFVPHDKWIVHFTRSLQWQPRNWSARLAQLFVIRDTTLESLKHRQLVIEQLYHEIEEELIKRSSCRIAPMMRGFYRALTQLLEKQTIPVDSWEAEAPLSLLNLDPFHKIVSVDQDFVRLQPAKLAAVSAADMYQWHYQVLRLALANT